MRLHPRRLLYRSGQAPIEYALILALASLGIVSILIILQGSSLGTTMQATGRQRDGSVGKPAGLALPGQPSGGETGTARPAVGGGDGWSESGDNRGHGDGNGTHRSGSGNGGTNGRN